MQGRLKTYKYEEKPAVPHPLIKTHLTRLFLCYAKLRYVTKTKGGKWRWYVEAEDSESGLLLKCQRQWDFETQGAYAGG